MLANLLTRMATSGWPCRLPRYADMLHARLYEGMGWSQAHRAAKRMGL